MIRQVQALTPAQKLERRYNSNLDSVTLIQKGKPLSMENDDWKDTLENNVTHLQMQVDSNDFKDFDQQPFLDSIKQGVAELKKLKV
jgi:hypothetical protein